VVSRRVRADLSFEDYIKPKKGPAEVQVCRERSARKERHSPNCSFLLSITHCRGLATMQENLDDFQECDSSVLNTATVLNIQEALLHCIILSTNFLTQKLKPNEEPTI